MQVRGPKAPFKHPLLLAVLAGAWLFYAFGSYLPALGLWRQIGAIRCEIGIDSRNCFIDKAYRGRDDGSGFGPRFRQKKYFRFQ